GERPRAGFWAFALRGRAGGAGYAARCGMRASLRGDALMRAALVACGVGYAEGARLSRRRGGGQVICWALVLALPRRLPLARATMPATFAHVRPPAWIGLGLAAALLGETVDGGMLLATLATVACVAGAKRVSGPA
ncbi:MAG: EamA/RhaT family transporter, partial [Lysobacteraceae bacterium]